MKDKEPYHYISELLKPGRENAISQAALCSITGLSASEVKRQVQRERLDGRLICSGKQGYWIAGNDGEMKDFIRQQESQAIKRQESLNAFRQAMRRINGQMEFSDWCKETKRM